ncbi:uncharacterized protein PHACADRAFT_135963 [Phanerochaete carnosa HHB-10118-sp]|uniref:Uncharacterized protein n=1 Tax=Phanerochaete carnosa (strain HHB-10118-sp) TaxID=650164 RepID=K5V7V9_PHACS|nr:uncharacterized protein PHACADRAFT_135963 [Phanerochaete carnosa HHB-10118-sp]EKM58831.1 hypothetical protein PHACADRAFT_135963 [Phanerochaete carnosa HHB-10118-sp]
MEDVISHEWERTFGNHTITAPDLSEWPNIALDVAGRLRDRRAFIGPTVDEAQPVKLKYLEFIDARTSTRYIPKFTVSADGKVLAASFWTNDVLIWRLSDGLLVQRLHHQGHTGKITSLAFSPNDHTLVSGSRNKTAIVWDIRRGCALLRLEGHSKDVDSIAYAPHGALIATASRDDRSVKVWDASTGLCLQSFRIGQDIPKLAFSPDGSRFYVKSSKSYKVRVTVRSATTGQELLAIDEGRMLSEDPIVFSPDGVEVLAICETDGTATTYDSRTGQLRRTFKARPGGVAKYRPRCRWSLARSAGLHWPHGRRGPTCEAEFTLSADSKLLAASFWTNDVLIWRLSDGLLVQRLHHQGHTDVITSLAFSPNDHILVSGSMDRAAIVWDIRRGCALLRLEGHDRSVNKIAYAPHGALIATASRDDRSVKVWDASTGACLQSFSVDNGIHELAFSPDCSRFYVKLSDSCSIYDTRSHTHIDDFDAISWAMSRQGDRIVTTTKTDKVRVTVRSATTDQELLAIDEGRVLLEDPLAFSPDSVEVLAICDTDRTATTYDSRTGQLRHTFKLSSVPQCAIYSPDGYHVVFVDKAGGVEVHNAKSGTFIAKVEGYEGVKKYVIAQIFPDSQTLLLRTDNGQRLHLYNIEDLLRIR